ncbi:phosphotransferase family protein [Kribbella shirazensis]|uniref:DNA-binding transcriptional regulator YdaS (Cro superfamily) n=1 Tax=Kribbella shirazensis TaxID=1105143 RepID=A0A7X5VGM6_9ACTN|nr:phosphotransferase [Kribbella shirazensis]NIK60142.1 DNA-binding transcriptional regulator YdaS (Cro superfamily) [Kribbella shirazensis]
MSRAPDVDYSATSARPDWSALPQAVREALADALGSRITAVSPPVSTGFTGGFAARAELTDGRQVFIKAAQQGLHAYNAYQREAEVVPQLPSAVRAPVIVTTARADDWFAVVSEWIDGRMPGTPWTAEDFERATAVCEVTAEALRPSPLEGLDRFFDLVRDDVKVPAQILAGERQLPARLQEWVPRVLPELADLVTLAPEVLVGDTAAHSDLRPDNLLIDNAGVCWTIDWNWLTLGPRWIDWVGLLPIAQHQGIDTFTAITRNPLTADVPKDHLDCFVAVIAAYMLKNPDLPPPPGCTPALREHQRLYAWTFLDWLAVRRNWPTVEV